MKYSWREKTEGFPWLQVAVVALVRLAEPLAFSSLFPYMFFMVRSLVPATTSESQIAWLVGWVSGSFAIAQCLTGIWWGRLSDRVGRKPVVVAGLVGSAVCLLLFGLSSSLCMALMTRALAGSLNGNMGVVRTVLGEIATQRRHHSMAFADMPLMWEAGCVVGPIVGGVLATRMHIAGHPYLAPNLAISGILLIIALVAALFLKETNPRKRRHPTATSPLLGGATPTPPALKDVLQLRTRMALAGGFLVSLQLIVFDEILPVFLSSSRSAFVQFPLHLNGGLGLTPEQVGKHLSLNGGLGILAMLLVYPVLERVAGTRPLYCYASCLFPAVFLAVPCLVAAAPHVTAATLSALLSLNLSGKVLASALVSPSILIIINESAAHKSHLAVINGVTLVCSGAARSLGPVLWGYLMQIGQSSGHGQLPWWALSCVSLSGAVFAFYVPFQD